MSRDFNDDKPKRSWREVDRNKDRSKHRQPGDKPMSKHKQDRSKSASMVYKSKLDAFFDGEGKAPEHVKDKIENISPSSNEGKARAKALTAIKNAGTSSAADKAVSAFLKKWELPPDFDILAKVLTCSDEDMLSKAMEILDNLLADKRVPRRAKTLEQRLRRVVTLADDPDLQDKANELVKTLRLYT